MAGKAGRSGRKKRPANVLKLHGTYRADRHAARGQQESPARKPTKPRGLGKHAAKLWRVVSRERRAWLSAEDYAALELLCQTWEALKRAEAGYFWNVEDGAARRAWHAASEQFLKLSARFGLTPADRAAMPDVGEPESKDPAARFLSGG